LLRPPRAASRRVNAAWPARGGRALLGVICLVLALPVLAVLGAWLQLDAAALAVLGHLLTTVLPGYAATSLALAAVVGIGVAIVGTATASAV
jgi:iron(III) transport system permease protein